MHVEIVSPEATLFSGEIESLTVPGEMGEFQMLNNHAPIVSLLGEGTVKIKGDITIEEEYEGRFAQGGKQETLLQISGGMLEFKDNKIVLLAD